MNPTEILRQLIQIPSVNPMGGIAQPEICFESRMSDWLVDFFASIGAPHERIEVEPGRDNVFAKYEPGNSDSTILLDAHQDTVPVVGMPHPFDGQQRDRRVFGRGACDVKGGMAAMLVAFARLTQERPAKAANVVMCCSCDEEAGMGGVRQLIRDWSADEPRSRLIGTRPSACVVAEPTDLEIVAAHLGVVRFRIRTLGRACHASAPEQGVNAIYQMAPVIERLKSEAARLATESARHPLCGRPTLSVGIIQGGTSVNIVPEHCMIEVDRRLVPGESPTDAWQQIRDGLNDLTDVVCDPPFLAAPALSDDANDALAGRLADAIAASGTVGGERVGASYCTNGSTIASAGVPTVVCGPGSISHAHTVDEQIEIAELETAAESYFQFCANYEES